jgi:hypothetical protein
MQDTEPIRSNGFHSRASAKRDALSAHLRQALQQTAFSNHKLIAPRNLDDIARKETESFFEFLRCEDEQAVREHGQQLAQQGLGHPAVLTATETIRRFCRESVNPGDEVAGRYVIALLDGYIAGREIVILKEQERTREAYLRARDRPDAP